MYLCFYSDELASNFLPLTLTRPIDDLRAGIFTIREKWLKTLKPNGWIRQTENYLNPLFGKDDPDLSVDYFWINSRLLPSKPVIEAISRLRTDEQLVWKGQVLCTKFSGSKTVEILDGRKQIKIQDPQIEFEPTPLLINHFWDLLAINGNQIASDIKLLAASFPLYNHFHPSVVLSNPEKILVHETAKIEPGCIFIADDGPIYIGANANIESGAILRGPVAIGENSVVKMGAKIFNGSAIGPVCKVGGEVNNCIFHSYSNKAHDGFAGNSILGQWCNFGAATNTSNLKNNYSAIPLPDWNTGKLSEQGVQFFGTVFGDFSKTAINTRLNTGTVCGVSSNIFTTGFPPKVIPSFAWLGDHGAEVYDFEKALIAMQAMMQRRGVELNQDYVAMMRQIFQLQDAPGS